MAGPSLAERVLRQDRYGTVEYAVRIDGTMEVKDWFQTQKSSIKAGFDVLFERLLTEGRIRDKTQFHPVEGDLWVFKKGDHRILAYRIENRWLLTNRYKKNRDATPPGEITHAFTVIAEHHAWELSQKSQRRKK